MKQIKLLFIVHLLFFIQKSTMAQFYVQPKVGAVRMMSRPLIEAPDLKSLSYYDDAYFGLEFGKKQQRFNHAIGYIYHPVGVLMQLGDFKTFAVGWGTKYMINHNVNYSFNYNLIEWKRISFKLGVGVNYTISRLTFPNSIDKSTGIITTWSKGQPIVVKDFSTTTAFEGHQLIIEPQINLDVRLSKKIAWTNHFGYTFGNRTLYTLESDYTYDDIPQPKAAVYVNGTSLMFGTGFKFYFKNQNPSENK